MLRGFASVGMCVLDMSNSPDLQRERTYVPIRFGRSLLMVRPLRAGTFSASPQAVERPVHGCTQAFHRMGWAPLENRRKIVDTKRCHGLVATPTRHRRPTTTQWNLWAG